MTTRSQLILAEQLQALAKTVPVTVAVQIMAAALMLLAMWGNRPAPWLAGWFLLVIAAQGTRLVSTLAFRRADPPPDALGRWPSVFTAGGLAGGGAWGVAAFLLFVPGSPPLQGLVTMVLAGLAAGSITSSSVFLPSSLAFVLASQVPLIARTALEGGLIHGITAILLACFLGFLLFFCRYLNGVISASLRMRYENMDLLDEMRRQKAAAEAADGAKSRFLAAASHDLRQPLHALGLFASALDATLTQQEVRPLVSKISSSVHVLEGLFSELLDISRLDAGAVVARPQAFELAPLLERLQGDCAPQAELRRLQLRVAPTHACVFSDPILLERILRNLISNAINYTREGGVVVGCRRRGQEWCIEVWDTGVGIPEAEQQRVFEEFYQLGNPERDRSKGLGLGLAIVRRLAALLGHDVEVHSRPGRGSVFRVWIGAAPDGWTAAAAAVPERAQAAPRGQLEGRVVLLVDDERDVRESMQALLTTWGCEVILAAGAEEALECLAGAGRHPDLMIADYRLRANATGLQAIEAVRAVYGASIPAVVVTADIAPELVKEVNSAGLRLLHKPVAPARLRSLLGALLMQAADVQAL